MSKISQTTKTTEVSESCFSVICVEIGVNNGRDLRSVEQLPRPTLTIDSINMIFTCPSRPLYPPHNYLPAAKLIQQLQLHLQTMMMMLYFLR